MGREIVMVGICTLMVIGLAWGMDHPKKELGALIALLAFVGMVLVAYVKNKNRSSRKPSRLIVKSGRRGDATKTLENKPTENDGSGVSNEKE